MFYHDWDVQTFPDYWYLEELRLKERDKIGGQPVESHGHREVYSDR